MTHNGHSEALTGSFRLAQIKLAGIWAQRCWRRLLFRSGLHERQLRAVAFKQKTSEHRSMSLMTVINHSLRGTAHLATLRAAGSTN